MSGSQTPKNSPFQFSTTPAGNPGAGGGLFGSQSGNSTSNFGASTNNGFTFGSGTNKSSNATGATGATGTGLFGQNSGQTSAQTPGQNSSQTSGTGLFGKQGTGGLFGAGGSSAGASATSGAGTGVGTSATSGSSALTGFATSGPGASGAAGASAPSLFGSTTPAGTPAPKLFGSAGSGAGSGTGAGAQFQFGKPAEGTQAPASTFGTQTASSDKPSEKPSMFGSAQSGQTQSQSNGLFGQAGGAKPSYSFGAKPDQPATTSGPALSFGQPADKSATDKPPTPAPIFGAAKANDASKPAAPSFGAKPDESKPATGFGAKPDESKPAGGLFGAKAGESKPVGALFGAKPAEDSKSAPSGLFNAKPAEDSKPAPGLFGAKPDSKPTLSFGAKPGESADTKKDAAPPLFGAKSEDKPTDSNAAKSTDDKKPALGSGPAASAASAAAVVPPVPSTYLKNKSFEDIIAKWTTATSKNSIEFQKQAAEISGWDKILVENGEKISDVYNQVVQAEQNQAKIDQLLDYVGRQQDDLEQLLDGYEKQATDYLSNLAGPDGLQPVDQEREKAYRLAEDLNEKLETMTHHLTTVTEEANVVSNDLNNAKEEDALTQIVKILNSHLASLQWIDTNTVKLQEKLDNVYQLEKGERF